MVRLVAVVAVFGVAAAAQAQPYDHLACYKVKDAAFASAQVSVAVLQAQFASLGCQIKGKARQVCVPVEAQVGAVDDGSHSTFPAEGLSFDRLCYRVKCTGSAPASLEMGDGFGTRTLEKFKVTTICTPAVIRLRRRPPRRLCRAPCLGRRVPACTGDCFSISPNPVCDARNNETRAFPCNLLNPGTETSAAQRLSGDSRCAEIDANHCGVFDPGS
jgi:hypothetical protein